MSSDSAEFIERVTKLLTTIEFEGYAFTVKNGHGVYVRGEYDEPDVYTVEMERQYTRKMTTSEIVQTVFKLCATSMEHRLREHFLYKGKRIFGPHFDVEDLVGLCLERENAGGRS